MSTTIQIKRSANIAAPSTTALLEAELAYSQDKSNDGAGAILYIESLDSTNAEVIHKVGGKYYTDIVDGATDANTGNKLVKRNASGNFSANVVTANQFAGAATSAGVANTANALTTGRYINLTGDAIGSAYFDGTGNADISVSVEGVSNVELGVETTGAYVANVLAGTGVIITNQGGETATPTIAIGQDVGTGASVTFNTVTADLFGQANSAVISNTANTLTTGRYINLSGDAVGSAFFDGSGNADITVTVEGVSNVELGVETTGAYVANVLAGTGVTITNQGGETAAPTIAIGQDVATTANVTFNQANLTTANINGTILSGGGSGFFVSPVAAGTTGNIVFYNTSTKELTFGAPAASSFTIIGDTGTDTFNTGDTLAIIGGTGVGTAATDNTITITNLGVTGVATGFGLSTSAANGSITLNNTGVTQLSAGSGLSVDSNSGNITITNLGVTSVSGTANEIEVSASNASVQIGLPDDVTIGNNLTVTGNLFVNGTVTTINTATISLEDPLIKFGNANPTDSLDIGFFGEYSSSGTKFAGLFRDASDSGTFKLFKDLTVDPTTNVISTGDFTVATLLSNLTGGTVSGLASAIAVGDGGTGANTFTSNGVLYGQGTSAFAVATGTAGQVLQLNVSGVPVFAGLDGGTY